jgi:hypothetical protein
VSRTRFENNITELRSRALPPDQLVRPLSHCTLRYSMDRSTFGNNEGRSSSQQKSEEDDVMGSFIFCHLRQIQDIANCLCDNKLVYFRNGYRYKHEIAWKQQKKKIMFSFSSLIIIIIFLIRIVGTESNGTSATNWPIVPAPGDMRTENLVELWLARETEVLGENLPSATLPTSNPTWPDGREPGPSRWEASD